MHLLLISLRKGKQTEWAHTPSSAPVPCSLLPPITVVRTSSAFSLDPTPSPS